jgi:prevent-host-death family protein
MGLTGIPEASIFHLDRLDCLDWRMIRMRLWALQDAKNRLSEVVDRAVEEGPQTITRRGRETAVVMSVSEYRRLAKPEGGLVRFLRESPLVGVDLDLERVEDYGRELAL